MDQSMLIFGPSFIMKETLFGITDLKTEAEHYQIFNLFLL